MPKRRHYEETNEERWQRKKKKYENKLQRKNRLIIYSDEEEPITEGNREPEHEGQYEIPDPIQDSEEPPQAAPTAPPETAIEAIAESSVFLDVDPDLLDALGSLEEETTEWGEPIVDKVAKQIKPLLLNGFKKEEKESLLKKYPFPNNVTLTKAPTLNAEISAMLTEQSRNRDKRLLNKQNQIGSVLSAVTKATSLLLCRDPKIKEILSILTDAGKLLADSHYLETDTRRSLITPLVDKELVDSFKDRKRDDYLFGDKLGELVKNSRGIKKTGQLIQASTSNNLNYRGPSARGRPQKNYTTRGGGQQRPYRRGAPYGPQAPAPSRRQPFAQPAPPRRRQPPASVVAAQRAASSSTTTDRPPAGTHH